MFFLFSWTTSAKYVRTLGHENIGAQNAHEGGGNYLKTNAHFSIYALRVISPDSEQGPPVELISVTLIKRGTVSGILI